MNNNKCGFGIASLVMGIASATILFIGGSVLGLLGLIFGIVALRRKECNKGFAIGGIVTSCIGMIFGILVIIGCVFYQDEIQELGREIFGETQEYDEDSSRYKDVEDGKKNSRKDKKKDQDIDWDDDDWDSDIDWDDDDWDSDIDWDDDDWDNDIDLDDDDWTTDDSNKSQNYYGTDAFAGNSYSAGDDSVIYFQTDGTFEWYLSADDTSDNYYTGTYEMYTGEDALEYITVDLSDYGVTVDEMYEFFVQNADNEFYQMSNLCCVVLHNDERMMDGKLESMGKDTYYMGFYQDGYYDAANMDTGNYAQFTMR